MEKQENEAGIEFAAQEPSSAADRKPDPVGAKRNWIEVLVDPRTLQGLMMCGGGLLVLGLVVWLWSIGVFENKLIVATCLGVANVGLLAIGVSGARYSRYQTASKAITMLACLVMPLNLWFYDAQGLITLDQGGHLWVPALVCCALYVIVARLLADPLYVNAIVGGITMTGLLFLADHQVERFWEIMAPSSFLVVLGIICIHAERAFSPESGPFSRANFGRAFFRAGHVVMALGLIVLLVGRVVGRFYDVYFAGWDLFAMPAVAMQANLKLLAFALALGGAYSYIYSQIVVQAKGRYLVSAVLTLVWSAVILLDLLNVTFTTELVMLLTAVGGLLATGMSIFDKAPVDSADNQNAWKTLLQPVQQTSAALATTLNLTTLALGVSLFARARYALLHGESPYELSGMFVVAAIVGGIASLLAGRKSAQPVVKPQIWPIQAATLFAWLASDALLAVLGVQVTATILMVEMLIPLSIAVAALVTQHDPTRRTCATIAEILAAVLLVVGMSGSLGMLYNTTIAQSHTGLTVLFTLAAVSLGLSSRVTSRKVAAVLAAGSICAATWQLFLLLGVTQFVFVFAATCIGLICIASSYVVANTSESPTQFAIVSQWTGRICLSFSSVAVLLIALARLLTGEVDGAVLNLALVQFAAGGVAGWLSREAVWRRHFWVLATVQVVMTLLLINALSVLTFWQRGEVLLTVAGLALLGSGYWGWSREGEQRDDWVSFNLAMGSLLSALPLTLGMLVQRFDNHVAEWGWVLAHEAGVLFVGLLLLGAGVLCRIRWSTLVGGSTLVVYVLSLIGLIRLPEQLQSTAIYMMVGGGLFFGAAVLLSVYRDRLLAITKHAQAREGVFRVLKWR